MSSITDGCSCQSHETRFTMCWFVWQLNGCLRLCEWKVVLRQLRMPPPILNLIHDYDKTAPHPIEDWCDRSLPPLAMLDFS